MVLPNRPSLLILIPRITDTLDVALIPLSTPALLRELTPKYDFPSSFRAGSEGGRGDSRSLFAGPSPQLIVTVQNS